MKKTSAIQATVKLSGFAESKGGFPVFTDIARRLEIPAQFHLDDIKRVQKDCEILAEKLKRNPEEAAELFQLIVDNKHNEARKLSRKLGIDEQEFLEKEGGLIWLVVVVILLYATDAY